VYGAPDFIAGVFRSTIKDGVADPANRYFGFAADSDQNLFFGETIKRRRLVVRQND